MRGVEISININRKLPFHFFSSKIIEMNSEQTVGIVTGTCMNMCPQAELKLREREGLLHIFEMQEGTEKNKRPKADINRIVKEFSRPAAGKEEVKAHQLRPANVLVKTVDFLIFGVLTRTDVAWDHVYHYVFNRLRAVRQDMVIQRLTGLKAVEIYEKIISFHIFAEYRLCTRPPSEFDPKINETHTRECLKRLLFLYSVIEGPHLRRTEFESLYLLYNLGSTDALLHAFDLHREIRQSKPVDLCLQVTASYLERNYVRFFRLVKELPPLASCAISRHFIAVQSEAVCVMCHGFSSKNLKYPLSKLQNILCCDTTQQAELLCSSQGVTVSDGMICFLKTSIQEPGKMSKNPSSWIDEKLAQWTIPELLHGLDS